MFRVFTVVYLHLLSLCSVSSLVCCWNSQRIVALCRRTLQAISAAACNRFWEEGKNTSGNCIKFLWKSAQFDLKLHPPNQYSTHIISAQENRLYFHISSDHNDVCFDPCFTLRSWRVFQSACRRISASTSTRTSYRAVRRFAGPLRAASGPWPWGSRPPTRPLETP